ncbi:NACHT domain-containing protein, partial [Arachnia propionica]
MAMARRSELVDALAAVAVSALSGPLGAIGVSAASELVKLLQKARGRTSEEKELQKQVREAITAWADGERLDQDVVERGLAWAIEYVQAAGCQHELIADADFDPTQAAEAVLTQAKEKDDFWGTDPEYGVAERAVHVTYNALCPKLKAEGGVVLAAIQASRHEIRGSIDQLREDLLGIADRHELIDYLEKQIRDWDYSPWTQGRKWSQNRKPSLLERTLEIEDEHKTMSPAKALEGVWLLTVLGGPGSGKTWLARRIAREAAETALEKLRDPRVDPASVEFPLVTTVAEWVKRHETGFEGLVEAALPHESQEKILRLVLHPGARVLAVADSLDEGVSVNSARTLLNSLTSSPTRRLVVTSRPEAWHSATAGLRTKQDTRVGTLTELRYPADVHGYVEAWFTENPPTAQHLIRQLERRRELRATATSPLLLTFYCMLTEQEPDQELPRRRRELYRTIIDLLLAGGWETTEEHVDTDACRAILQQWAWDAVKDAITPAGLGVWPETITTNRTPPHVSAAMERALDNVAPKQERPRSSLYDHTRVKRRFLHRTLWEYLVSEHIATTFSAAKAAKALLPHIWFDPDWHITLPMAIAAHKKRSKLVDQLWSYHTDPPTPAQEVVNIYLEALMLEVAAQTDPEDWNKANQARIRSLRENLAPHHPELIVGSAHWGGLNHIEIILTALTHATPWAVPGLIGTLLRLKPSDKERAEAHRTILTQLTSRISKNSPNIVSALLELKINKEKQKETRQAILTALPKAQPLEVPDLARALLKLKPNNKERTKARHAILTALPATYSWGVSKLVRALLELEPNHKERTEAHRKILIEFATVLTQLTYDNSQQIPDIVDALLDLKPNNEERTEIRQVILAQLIYTNPKNVPKSVHALLKLDPNDEELAEARQTILIALIYTDWWKVPDLIHVLLDLKPNYEERVEICRIILAILTNADPLSANPGTDPWKIPDLVGALPDLELNDEERAEIRRTIFTQLNPNDPWKAPNSVRALLGLEPNDEERAEIRQTILAALSCTYSWGVPDLVHALLTLKADDKEKTEARQAILAQLAHANPWKIPDLVHALSELKPNNKEQAEARQTILTQLPNTDPREVPNLIDTLLELSPNNKEQAEARQTILTQLPNTDPREVPNLIDTLLELSPNNKELKEARQTILTQLPNTDPREVPN